MCDDDGKVSLCYNLVGLLMTFYMLNIITDNLFTTYTREACTPGVNTVIITTIGHTVYTIAYHMRHTFIFVVSLVVFTLNILHA